MPCVSARACGCVPRHEVVTDPAAVVVLLDPGLAFGTGTHATTAMCLTWLDAHVPRGAPRHRFRLRLGHSRDRGPEARRPTRLVP